MYTIIALTLAGIEFRTLYIVCASRVLCVHSGRFTASCDTLPPFTDHLMTNGKIIITAIQQGSHKEMLVLSDTVVNDNY